VPEICRSCNALLALAVLLCVAAPPLYASTSSQLPDGRQPETLTISRVDVPPKLEDYLDGQPPDGLQPVTEFVQRDPGDGVPASQRTEAYLSYDDHHLYVIFVARDSEPGRVRATLTRREGFENDDTVGIALDTFHDQRRAYLFVVNPLGVQRDAISQDDGDDDESFDTVWESEGQLTDFGYVVRIAIPFKSLRFPNRPEQEWGIALIRDIPRNNEASFFPYITRRVSSFIRQMAIARGLREISPGRNLQLIPYAAFAGARFLDADRPAFVTDRDGRAGVDGKIVVRDAFTVDLTFNPDFSQIESDEPQVTINQRFEVFFPEKRPFFIENASYFDTPINLFFSRRIVDPQVGARVTGKSGGWAIGGLAMDDRAPGELVVPEDPAFEKRAGIGVFRLQLDLPRQSAIGVLATTRGFGVDQSQVAAIDGRYRLSDTWVVTGQVATSRLEEEGETLTGPAVQLMFDRTGRNWGAFLRLEDIGEDFRAPLGFVRRTDTRVVNPYGRYTWFPEWAGLVSLRPELSGTALWNHAGTLEDWNMNAEFQAELKGQTQIEVGFSESMERFEGVEFRKRGYSASFETALLKWLEGSASIETGREINFFPSAGVQAFLADGTEAEVSVTLKPVAQLRLDQTYLFTRLAARDNVPQVQPGAVIVDNHIWRSRASYQFTRRLSLRAILDYSAVLPDTILIDLEREKRFTADLLATYQIDPWTAIYVGYTDGYGNLEIDPLSRDRLRPTDSAFHSLGRQVFVKTSYLLRF
jgi:hypothetical protein